MSGPLAERTLLTVRTVRHLRPSQVVHRLRLRSQHAVTVRMPGVAEQVLRPRRRGRPPGWPAKFEPLDAQDPDGFTDARMAAKGRFCFLNQCVDLGLPPSWAPSNVGRLWSFHLHYAEWAWSFGALDDREWAQQAFARLWTSWRTSTQFGQLDEWSPYVASVRAWALCGTFAALAGGTPWEDELIEDLNLHRGFLRWHLESDVGGNHLLKNLKALIGLGVFFADDSLLAIARRRLVRELGVQVLADGGHYERSPSYHCQVLGDLIDVGGLMDAALLDPVEGLTESVDAMRRWLAAMLLPDGDVPLFNDCVLVGESRLQLLGPGPAQEQPVTVLHPSGYVVARMGRLHVVADVGPPCPPDLPAHAHADCLTFELAVDGRRLVVDSGTSTYERGARRSYERSTKAHNTVEIDGHDQTEVWGTFRAARRADAVLESATSAGDGLTVVGSHSGYRRLPGHVEHRRTWKITGDRLEIIDDVEGTGHHHVVLRWHLASGTSVDVSSGRTVIGDLIDLRVEGPGDVDVPLGLTTEDIATSFGRRTSAPVLEAFLTGNLPVRLRTTFQLRQS